jgi:hypothetical protein
MRGSSKAGRYSTDVPFNVPIVVPAWVTNNEHAYNGENESWE